MTLRAVRFHHSAWRVGAILATAFTAVSVEGCSFFYDLNTTQCEVDGDCKAFGPQFANTQCLNRVCVDKGSGSGGMTGTGGKTNSGGAGGVGGLGSGGIDTAQGGITGGGTAGTAGDTSSGGSGPPPECETNGDCITAHLEQPYICSAGTCVAVTNDDCPVMIPTKKGLDYLRKAAPLLIGGFASMTNDQDFHDTQAIINWDLALDEMNSQSLGGFSASGGVQRPVVGVMCQGKTADVTPAMDHLTGDLKVPAILSTLSVDNLNAAWQYTRTAAYATTGGQPVFFMSTGSADLRLANLADEGLVWHQLGDPRVLAATTASLVKRLEPFLKQKRQDFATANASATPAPENPNTPLRVALVIADDLTMIDIGTVLTTIDDDHPDSVLTFNGFPAAKPENNDYFQIINIESVKVHQSPNTTAALAGLAAKPPHLIVAMTTGEFPSVMSTLESNWGKSGQASEGMMRPYYLLSHLTYNTQELKTPVTVYANAVPPLNLRALGVNYAQAQESHAKDLYNSYLARLQGSYSGSLAVDGTENYYDGAYSMLYALAAASAARSVPDGTHVRDGLDRVYAATGKSVDIGPANIGTALGNLGTAGYRMSLYGTMGPPNFDRLSGTRISATSAWCIEKVGSVWTYKADGLIYDPATKTFAAPTTGAPTCLQQY